MKKILSVISRFKRPPGVITWRYFINESDPMIRQHKRAFFYLPNDKNFLLSIGTIIIQQLSWWCFFGWKSIFNIWQQRKKLFAHNQDITFPRLLWDLIFLTFALNVPPHHYHWFRLYRYDKSQWLQFVYEHEAQKWNRSLSKKISEKSEQFINSKYCFAQQLTTNNLPAIKTIRFIHKGELLEKKDVCCKQSFFFKPNVGSGGIVGMALHYEKLETECYRLEGNDFVLDEIDEIVKYLNSSFHTQDYLQQPLLISNLQLTKTISKKILVTIRIITVIQKGDCRFVDAFLTIPSKNRRLFLRINIDSGVLATSFIGQHFFELDKQESIWLERNKHRSIQSWKNIKNILQTSHSLCPDVYTIGWDIALTDLGVFVLEGNIGYSLLYHQIADETRKEIDHPLKMVLKE